MYASQFGKLETKNSNEILKIIKSTKSKMGKLKRIMENPSYKPTKCPTELTMYKCEREFLDSAICKYILLTGEYNYSNIEKKDVCFNQKLDNLVKITFNFNEWISPLGYTNTIRLSKLGEKDKISLVERLKNLHIGEWRKNYTPDRYGVCVLDGNSWSLTLEFKERKKLTYNGINAYPYNFRELTNILEEYECFVF